MNDFLEIMCELVYALVLLSVLVATGWLMVSLWAFWVFSCHWDPIWAYKIPIATQLTGLTFLLVEANW